METAFTFPGYQTKQKTLSNISYAVAHYQAKDKAERYLPSHSSSAEFSPPDLGPHAAVSSRPAFLASSTESCVLLSSVPGSWFIYFKMPFPTFINLY